jgi:hypothetical protein
VLQKPKKESNVRIPQLGNRNSVHLTRKNSWDDGLGDVVELVDIFDRSDHFGAFQNDGKETDRKLTNSSTSPKFPLTL